MVLIHKVMHWTHNLGIAFTCFTAYCFIFGGQYGGEQCRASQHRPESAQAVTHEVQNILHLGSGTS